MLRDAPATGGLLPKIMAAYNAGLTPITRWNSEVRDQGDPLLYMEIIPYWETRSYVAHRDAQLLDVRAPGRRRLGKPHRAGARRVADLPRARRRAGGAAERERQR